MDDFYEKLSNKVGESLREFVESFDGKSEALRGVGEHVSEKTLVMCLFDKAGLSLNQRPTGRLEVDGR